MRSAHGRSQRLTARRKRGSFVDAIEADPVRLLSLVGVVRASLVMLGRKRDPGPAALRAFLEEAEIEQAPVDTAQAEAAVEAFRRFGCGRHPARLNIGNCFAYALAKTIGEALLFKGGDFGLTDIAAVI